MKRYTFKIKTLATIALLATGINAWADTPNNPTPSMKPVIQHIVVFGDSLSDTGNFYNFTGAISKIPFSPIKSALPAKPYDYRFSNGWTWPEYLAKDIGWQLPSPAKNKDEDIDDISHFSNHPNDKLAVFAYGGAWAADGILDHKVIMGRLIPDVQRQIKNYISLRQRSASTDNTNNTLYIILAGGNDFIGSLDECKGRFQSIPACDENIVDSAVRSMHVAVNTLINRVHAQHILILTVPDLSLTPFIKKFPVKNGQLRVHREITGYPGHYLGYDDQLIAGFKNRPDVTVSSISQTSFLKVYDTYKKEGKSLDSCIVKPIPHQSSGTPQKPNAITNNPALAIAAFAPTGNSNTVTCKDGTSPKNHLFWDGVHPTTHIHRILADVLFKQLRTRFTFDPA